MMNTKYYHASPVALKKKDLLAGYLFFVSKYYGIVESLGILDPVVVKTIKLITTHKKYSSLLKEFSAYILSTEQIKDKIKKGHSRKL